MINSSDCRVDRRIEEGLSNDVFSDVFPIRACDIDARCTMDTWLADDRGMECAGL